MGPQQEVRAGQGEEDGGRQQAVHACGIATMHAVVQIAGAPLPRRYLMIVEVEMAAGRAHTKFCFEMYELQRKNGRFFAHEHPSTATSWS